MVRELGKQNAKGGKVDRKELAKGGRRKLRTRRRSVENGLVIRGYPEAYG